MTEEEKNALRTNLETKITGATTKIAQMEEMTQPVSPENAIGRISRMDAINNKSVMEAALRNARAERDALAKALQSIDRADFGICQKCRSSIPMARMMAMPGSTFCATCAR